MLESSAATREDIYLVQGTNHIVEASETREASSPNLTTHPPSLPTVPQSCASRAQMKVSEPRALTAPLTPSPRACCSFWRTQEVLGKSELRGSPSLKAKHKELIPTFSSQLCIGTRVISQSLSPEGSPSPCMILHDLKTLGLSSAV